MKTWLSASRSSTGCAKAPPAQGDQEEHRTRDEGSLHWALLYTSTRPIIAET